MPPWRLGCSGGLAASALCLVGMSREVPGVTGQLAHSALLLLLREAWWLDHVAGRVWYELFTVALSCFGLRAWSSFCLVPLGAVASGPSGGSSPLIPTGSECNRCPRPRGGLWPCRELFAQRNRVRNAGRCFLPGGLAATGEEKVGRLLVASPGWIPASSSVPAFLGWGVAVPAASPLSCEGPVNLRL